MKPSFVVSGSDVNEKRRGFSPLMMSRALKLGSSTFCFSRESDALETVPFYHTLDHAPRTTTNAGAAEPAPCFGLRTLRLCLWHSGLKASTAVFVFRLGSAYTAFAIQTPPISHTLRLSTDYAEPPEVAIRSCSISCCWAAIFASWSRSLASCSWTARIRYGIRPV